MDFRGSSRDNSNETSCGKRELIFRLRKSHEKGGGIKMNPKIHQAKNWYN